MGKPPGALQDFVLSSGKHAERQRLHGPRNQTTNGFHKDGKQIHDHTLHGGERQEQHGDQCQLKDLKKWPCR